MRTIDDIIHDASALTDDQKILLVDLLLTEIRENKRIFDSEWSYEVERRVDEITGDHTDLVDGEKVFAEIKKKYGK